MRRNLRNLGTLVVAMFSALALAQTAAAQDQDPIHIRGEIASFGDGTLIVNTDEGDQAEIKLTDESGVFTVSKATLEDVKAGRFVGITSVMTEAGRRALEVHIFDESLRGIGEGHYPWDLVPQENMMTNASVAQVAEAPQGREVLVAYTAGEDDAGAQNIIVPEEAMIVNLFPGSRDLLKKGERVFVIAQPQADGTYVAPALVVGQGDVDPPM